MPRSRRDGTPARPPRKRKLTQLLVKRQRPAARAYLIWDTKLPGLALQIQPSGTRTFKVIYSYHGRPRWLHLGNANSIGLAAARRLAMEIMVQVARARDPAAEKRAARAQGTFAELAQRYVAEYASKRNKSWRQAAHLVTRWVLPKWAKLAPATITRADVRVLLGQLAHAPMLANQVLAATSAIFSWARKQDVLAVNPCSGIERNATAARDRILAASEVPKFWRAFDEAGLVVSAALKLCLLTGQRPGEVTHMRWEHIVDGWWEMPGVPQSGWPGTKNKQAHRVWLAVPVLEVLADFDAQPAGYVLATPRGAAVIGLAAAMRNVCAKLNAPRATPHDLRRTFSSCVTGLGFGINAMNRVTNHKEGGIASVYDRHTYAEENKAIMEKVAAHFIALAGAR